MSGMSTSSAIECSARRQSIPPAWLSFSRVSAAADFALPHGVSSARIGGTPAAHSFGGDTSNWFRNVVDLLHAVDNPFPVTDDS
jgi:hypothetical protein